MIDTQKRKSWIDDKCHANTCRIKLETINSTKRDGKAGPDSSDLKHPLGD